MVALPPVATTSFPGISRPAPATPPIGVDAPARVASDGQGSPATAAVAEATARSREAQEQARAEANRNAERAQLSGEDRPKAQLPQPRFAQNVGLFDDSFRVFVDIVLATDSSQRVARVYGTPPAPKLETAGRGAAGSVNISA